jgi:hypothetical protein
MQSLPTNGSLADLDWDLFLTTTNEYKESLKGSGLAKDLLQDLLLFQHPRFIWRALLCIAGTPTLELLVDATDMARSFPIYRALWHNATVRHVLSQLLNEASLKDILTQFLTPRFYDLLKNASPP